MTERKGLLPFIDAHNCLSTFDEVMQAEQSISIIKKRIAEVNPIVLLYLNEYARLIHDPNNMVCNAFFVYKALEDAGSLPLVSYEIGYLIQEEFRDNDKEFVHGMILRLKEDNPYVVNFILRHSMKTCFPAETACGGLGVYRLLEKKAELQVLQNPQVPLDKMAYPITHELREQLNLALATEQYELAVLFRDKINATDEPL